MWHTSLLMWAARNRSTTIILLLLAVVVLFFVHAPSGGFQATSGPHSTLQELSFHWKILALVIFLADITLRTFLLVSLQIRIRAPQPKFLLLPMFANDICSLLC